LHEEIKDLKFEVLRNPNPNNNSQTKKVYTNQSYYTANNTENTSMNFKTANGTTIDSNKLKLNLATNN